MQSNNKKTTTIEDKIGWGSHAKRLNIDDFIITFKSSAIF